MTRSERNPRPGRRGDRPRSHLVAALTALAVVLLAAFAVAFGSCAAAPAECRLGSLSGAQSLTVFGAMLVAGGAFAILRVALARDDGARLEALRQEMEFRDAQMRATSIRDELTGLHNRRFLDMRVEEEVARYSRFGHAVSVVLLDVDGFSGLVGANGAPAGEETLRGVATLLRQHSRGLDVVCRYEGDRFGVLLVETGKDGALLYAERMRKLIEAAAFSHGAPVTASFGVACLPTDTGPLPDELVTTADWALAEAKRAGRNMVADRDGAVQVGRGRRGGWDL